MMAKLVIALILSLCLSFGIGCNNSNQNLAETYVQECIDDHDGILHITKEQDIFICSDGYVVRAKQ
jgi:uncharacterized protein YcfL